MSVMPRISDSTRTSRKVRVVLKADIADRTQAEVHANSTA
jgi:hypothetical protein